MRIGVIGAGGMGETLAHGLAKLGHQVSIANSRGPESLTALAATSLSEKGVPKGTRGRIALSVFGDASDARAAGLRLVDDLGFDPVEGGDLDSSWRQQPGTPAYCRDLDAAGLRRALAKAERSLIPQYRAQEEARIRRSIAAQDA